MQNVQSGLDVTTGVTATATPGLIGVSVDAPTTGNLTIANNAVTAKANVNYASNALKLVASNTHDGSAAVNKVQTSSDEGGVTATIGATAGAAAITAGNT